MAERNDLIADIDAILEMRIEPRAALALRAVRATVLDVQDWHDHYAALTDDYVETILDQGNMLRLAQQAVAPLFALRAPGGPLSLDFGNAEFVRTEDVMRWFNTIGAALELAQEGFSFVDEYQETGVVSQNCPLPRPLSADEGTE